MYACSALCQRLSVCMRLQRSLWDSRCTWMATSAHQALAAENERPSNIIQWRKEGIQETPSTVRDRLSTRDQETFIMDTGTMARNEEILRQKQLELEGKGFRKALERYRMEASKAIERGDATMIRPVNDLLVSWLYPLTLAIKKEFGNQRSWKIRAKRGPMRVELDVRRYINLLPADHLAVIVAHEVLGAVLREPEGAHLSRLALTVGRAVQAEVNLKGMGFLRKEQKEVEEQARLERETCETRKEPSGAEQGYATPKSKKGSLPPVVSALTFAALRTQMTQTQWDDRTLLLIGSSLISVMLKTAFIEENNGENEPQHRFKPAIVHAMRRVRGHSYKTIGVVKCRDAVLERASRTDEHLRALVFPKRQPMVVEPIRWISPTCGGYLRAQEHLVRTPASPQLVEALRRADLSQIYRGLNALGENKWCVNGKILSVAKSLWRRGGGVAGLVSREDLPVPKSTVASADESTFSEKDQMRRERKRRAQVRKVNRERHSLRCEVIYKLTNAEEFKDYKEIYLPHNLDFRGRAYPIPVHLQHMGADLTRAMLTFAGPGKELGVRGVYWLKVHLANLMGADKLSFDERIEYAEARMKKCVEAAMDPFCDSSLEFWSTKSDPFQLLAACEELRQGLGRYGTRDNLESFKSTLPISMDGSCNGLQHYAALGRDQYGGEQVNLVPGPTPQDVYSEVAARVSKQVEADAKNGDEIAKELVGKITRKIVKQTVMTSVYGVTVIGAREQIKNRLREVGIGVNEKGEVEHHRLFAMSFYLAKLTLTSLGVVFEGATKTMEWLGAAARRIGAIGREVQWVTPLGLPVIQPYRAHRYNTIKTLVQRVKLERREGHMPVSPRRQASAFAPNYVHSVDSSHMLMTAIRAKECGLNFAAVHDSFWTNAADVDRMNKILRETFVELHGRELLAELREYFLVHYPGLKLSPLPGRGSLDLNDVLHSPYFFS